MSAALLTGVGRRQVSRPAAGPERPHLLREVGIPDDDTRRLELEDSSQTDIFVVVRAASELADFTANLAAPVALHTERRPGRQIMNDTRGYAVGHPLFSEVELRDV